MLKKITIKFAYNVLDYITDDSETMINEVRVWAWVDGAFAIHKGIDLESSKTQSPRHWVLTHVATSGVCKTSLNKQDVIETMCELKGWNLGGKPLESVKACDIVEFATLLPAMNGKEYKKDSAEKYTKNVKPLFEKALGCK